MADDVVNEHIQSHIVRLTEKKAFVVAITDLIIGYSHYQKIKDIDIDLTYINTCPDDCDIIVIDYTTNYTRFEIEEDIFKLLSQHAIAKPWIILTSDIRYYNKEHSHIVYYPIHFIDGIDKGSNTDVEIKNHRAHNICFLTYHFHWHRVILLLYIYKHIGLNSCLINLPKLDALTESQAQSLKNSFVYLTKDEKEITDEIFKLAPLVADATDPQIEILNIDNKAFCDSYVNIFTESDYPKPIVTEKSIKPFLSGQFFAVLGHPSAYTHLKELGFDLLEDILPMPQHSSFRQQAQELVEATNTLLPNINLVWDQTYERRLHNYKLARSPELRDKLCFDFQKHLNSI